MRYSVKVSQNKYGVLKIVILAVCLLADLISLVGVISAISSKTYADIALYVAIMAGVFLVQFGSIFLTFTVECTYDNGVFRVSKIYPVLRQVKVEAAKGTYSLTPIEKTVYASSDFDKNITRLCVNACPYAIYVLELSGKKYAVNLDDYLYAIATEEDNDLS